MQNAKLISVTVRDRHGLLFEDFARAVSSFNAKGQFDILPLHANFISTLKKKLILHLADGSKQEIHLNSGVVKVLQGKVFVYAEVKQ